MSDELSQNNNSIHRDDNSDTQKNAILSARNFYAKGQYKESLDMYLSIIHKTTDANIYIELGNCYYKLNFQKEALDSWEKAAKLDPQNAKAFTNTGNLYYKNNKIDNAISCWLTALTIRPEDSQTSLNLAVAFDKKEMRFEAIKYFEKYIKYEENKATKDYINIKDNIKHCYDVASQYLNLGAELQTQGQNEQAAQCYFKALANYPNLSKINLNLGSIFFSDKNYELAIKYWLTANHLEPNYDKTYSNLAISYDLMEKFDYALYYYHMYMNFTLGNETEYNKVNKRYLKLKKYMQQHTDLIPAHLYFAQDYLAKNEIYKAIDEFKIYTVLCPAEKAKYKDVIQKLESYINPEKALIETNFEQGDKLLKKGKYKEAKAHFARVLKLSAPRFLEYSKAKAKYSQCEKLEVGYND
ncbi:MAG: tetratricopeptide repeat protein [bacterium]|nr:tetratricopeptide repeat protein [bacterium]